jgi:Ser/Thr protein kinase RdoA (MazF antagonist)
MTGQQLETVGREMALIHNITSSLELSFSRKEYSINSTIIEPLTILKPAFKGLEGEYNWLRVTAEIVVEKLQQFDLEKFSYGYCHYDFMPKNFHLDDNGNITFFDFDFAGKGYLANDVLSFYMHYFFEIYFNRTTREEADRSFYEFVEGYRKVRALTDEELKSIRYLGFGYFLFYLRFTFENFDDWSSIFFNSQYLKVRVGMIKKWMNDFGVL